MTDEREAPEVLFRRIEYDKTAKRARPLFCLASKPGAVEVKYVRADLHAAVTAERDALREALERCPPSKPGDGEFADRVAVWWANRARPALKGET